MQDITLILLAAGSSTRFGLPTKKQWLYQGSSPLWLSVADSFAAHHPFAKIIVVGGAEEVDYMQLFADYCFVTGGNSRQASLTNALEKVETPYVLVNDIARCCLDWAMIARIITHNEDAACIVPAIKVVDTLYLDDEAIDRERVRAIQTPQLSTSAVLRKALATEAEFTDESSAIRALGEKVLFVEGSAIAHKLTTPADLGRLPCLIPPLNETRVGFGLDIHAFEEGKAMKLCGVTIDAPFGFKAHSDGDVAIHALIDALLGAAGLGDIGELFPDTDPGYENADSTLLLQKVLERIRGVGFDVGNVDLTILAQTPRLLPYKAAMRTALAKLLELDAHRVNIKATTAEKMGFVGRKEGVTVHAVATLRYYNWTEVV